MNSEIINKSTVYEEIYVRGPFGKFIRFIFVAFNILMAVWMLGYWYTISNMTCKSMYPDDFSLQAVCASNNSIMHTGSQIGGIIGTFVISVFWLVGAVILGIFSRATSKKRLIVSEPSV
jgi:hypothetical protein